MAIVAFIEVLQCKNHILIKDMLVNWKTWANWAEEQIRAI